jgi:UDP-N-acetylglucosamine--N-acetylmuramyl-(pentapeptide) pyrophosphoryl-undecaprenol N-acetylglucosamine transferase
VRVALAGGGTAGHVFPALALGRTLARRGESVEFLGTASGPEARIVPGAGFPFREVDAVPVAGKTSLRSVLLPWKLFRSIRACVPLVESADVVVGMGGYVSVPAVAAAVRLRRPVVLHEQNSVPGLANRWLARPAKAVAISFPDTARSFPKRVRTVVTGNPIREEIAAVPEQRSLLAKEALRELDLEEGRTTVLVFGGSQGARHINEASIGATRLLRDRGDLQLLILAGPNNVEEVAGSVASSGSLRVRIHPFVDRMELAYAAADLAVARSGATTVAELTCCGLPAILIPYPHHKDRQQELNARILQRAGAATVLADEDLTPELLVARMNELLGDPVRLRRMADRAHGLGRPDAAIRLADVVEAAATEAATAAGGER